jgi:hypothetical protein
MADRFFIAPYDASSGLQTNVKPWLIPDEAFAVLNNAYVFRGRVRKRFGSYWLNDDPLGTRLRVDIGTTNGLGNFTGFTPRNASSVVIVTPAIGQQFSIDVQVFTVDALGTPANMLISGTATSATFNTTTGAVSIMGALPFTPVFYYPALPVMGILTYDVSGEDKQYIAFDTRFAYTYDNIALGWKRLTGEVTPNASIWTGSDSQFFWGTTWVGNSPSDEVFFVTNFNPAEPNFMRYFFNNQWNNFEPAIDSSNFLISALILVPFKNRLLAFNTFEGTTNPGTNYAARCRYSQIGSPLASTAWRQDIFGLGGAIDATTTEEIITVEFVKDRLIVYFDSSTYELVYTGNQAFPFTWQKINTELGAESTFSIVPFDKVAIGIGNVGIHACNGITVERIDDKIPDTVFEIINANEGPIRTYGIRDYYLEMVYWTFPDIDNQEQTPYPNRVLVYNYKNGTWAFNYDSITCFGYFQQTNPITWDSTSITWDSSVSWTSGSLQSEFKNIIAGNQEGFTFICDSDEPTNAAVLQITQLAFANNVITVTCINHNLRDGEYVYLTGITGTGNVDLLNGNIYRVIFNIDANTFTFIYDNTTAIIAGNYTGGGLISRVSNINIRTKEYNFYAKQGRNAYVSKVDFMVDTTPVGQLQVNYFVSTSTIPLLQNSIVQGSILGTGNLDTFPYVTDSASPPELGTSRLWHPVYFQADGEFVQFQIVMNDAQMRDTQIRLCDFQLHAMVIHAVPASYRLQ